MIDLSTLPVPPNCKWFEMVDSCEMDCAQCGELPEGARVACFHNQTELLSFFEGFDSVCLIHTADNCEHFRELICSVAAEYWDREGERLDNEASEIWANRKFDNVPQNERAAYDIKWSERQQAYRNRNLWRSAMRPE